MTTAIPAADFSGALTNTLKALEKMGMTEAPNAVGAIPIFNNGKWEYVFNRQGLVPGAENCADPHKVEILRRTAASVSAAFPETIDALAKAGYRSAKSLMTKPINTVEDVKRWADSIFNWGPGRNVAGHVEAEDLAYDDFVVRHTDDGWGDEVFVVPEGPRGSGIDQVRVIHAHPDSEWGRKLAKGQIVVLGRKHDLTKAAFASQGKNATAKAPTAPPEAPVVPQEAPKAAKAAKTATAAPTDLQAVRAWAKHNGYAVGDRGRIPAEVTTAYNEAIGTGTAPTAVAPKAPQKPAKVTKKAVAKKATKAPAADGVKRGRGRPRADGLVSGSPEAIAADAAKKSVSRAATKKLPDSAVAKMEAADQAAKILAAEKAPAKAPAETNVTNIEDAPKTKKRVIRRATVSAPASA